MNNIRYASKFGPNLQNTLDAIGHSRDFNAGTLKGKTLPIPYYVGQTGSLPKEWRDQMVKDSPVTLCIAMRPQLHGWQSVAASSLRLFLQ